ncbi:Type-1 fimbrial protein, A chain precursor [Phytobacter ursingii]|nr:Type-1 fimbrial protein, A chain precursor [Phytobacter ursingii]
MNKLISPILFSVGFISCAPECWADCSTLNPQSYERTLPSFAISVPKNSVRGPVGNVMSLADGPSSSVSCNAGNVNMKLQLGTTMTPSDYDPTVYKTNIPGIGIKIWSNWVMTSGWPSGTPIVTLTDIPQYWYSWPASATSAENRIAGINVQFYIIGPVSSGTVTLPSPMVAAWANTGTGDTGAVKYSELKINSGNVIVTAAACKTPDIHVDLQKHASSDFPTVGATSPATPFNFEIQNCDPNINSVNYTFKPAPGVSLVSDGNSDQHITLDSASSASGVGIQVLYNNDTLVPFNSKITYTGYNKTTGGSYTIPMKARYIRTGAVTAGTANSAVEFIMTYE